MHSVGGLERAIDLLDVVGDALRLLQELLRALDLIAEAAEATSMAGSQGCGPD
jgi:hypothetical protein